MNTSTVSARLTLIRQLLRELRRITPKDQKVRNTDMYKHIMAQSRKYQVTEKKVCKAQDEMIFHANTYLCYLNSTRKYQELCQHYHGKGERGIAETAALVGLKLPKLYPDE